MLEYIIIGIIFILVIIYLIQLFIKKVFFKNIECNKRCRCIKNSLNNKN